MLTSLLKYKKRGNKVNASVLLTLKWTQNAACLLTITKID